MAHTVCFGLMAHFIARVIGICRSRRWQNVPHTARTHVSNVPAVYSTFEALFSQHHYSIVVVLALFGTILVLRVQLQSSLEAN